MFSGKCPECIFAFFSKLCKYAKLPVVFGEEHEGVMCYIISGYWVLINTPWASYYLQTCTSLLFAKLFRIITIITSECDRYVYLYVCIYLLEFKLQNSLYYVMMYYTAIFELFVGSIYQIVMHLIETISMHFLKYLKFCWFTPSL